VTRVVVLADTHIRPTGRRRLPDAVYDALAGADAILHAGDLLVADVLHELGGFAPTFAVLGNNDHGLVGALPDRRIVDIDGLRIGMVHDAGPRAGREGRLRRWFPDAGVVVFGHSHAPFDQAGLDGQWLMNPGSPTERRMAPRHTYGVLEVTDGRLVGHAIVPA
jgi:putative phosphoesterase